MEQNMLNDNNETIYYVVMVNGAEYTGRYTDKMLAEMEKMNLPEDLKKIAEVVAVNADGDRLLLG